MGQVYEGRRIQSEGEDGRMFGREVRQIQTKGSSGLLLRNEKEGQTQE